ncbi:phosphocholine cytidylyltransferase family protein [Spectribacter hydrogenoxidans]|uniref:Phosphocholine cytidylyltransferase family protein n=1 Tax=Spectribacter hydrogenoxidans TaxID=3075608 RepID=A0ABU3C0E0_9GAMM|nr:phosphocholine cytidylyltransferase family protein [Salinisphaera sp. W335]MDT0635024.1 phosphocholine cytidylyltransferase family protein [Salinisphaera sp. W335]
MQAIILAAGVGSRLGIVDGERRPKCLLEIGGMSLLDRHLQLLERAGVGPVTLVTGFQAGILADAVRTAVQAPRLCHNPDYERGSVLSLDAAADVLTSGDEVLVMDADVLYHPAILARLVAAPRADLFLLDRDFEPGDEPVKLCVAGGQLMEFRKRPDPGDYEVVGESVGFFRLSAAMAARLAGVTAAYAADGRGDQPHEEAIRDLLRADPAAFDYLDITGLPWIEIDFPADVERARQEILPALANADEANA